MRGRTQPMGFDCKHGYAQEEYRPIADTIKRTEIGLLTGAAEGREQGGTPPPPKLGSQENFWLRL